MAVSRAAHIPSCVCPMRGRECVFRTGDEYEEAPVPCQRLTKGQDFRVAVLT